MMRSENEGPRISYIRETFAAEDPVLQECRQFLQSQGKGGIQVGAEEGRLLQFLARTVQAKKVVEIGTLGGYSTIWLARALGEGGKVWAFEKDPFWAEKSQEFFRRAELDSKIELREGDARERLAEIGSEGPFDMVFIDANKAGYMDYLDWADKNLRSGGLIVADNTFLFGEVYQQQPDRNSKRAWEVMRAFNQWFKENADYTSILIPTVEGMTVAVKERAP